MGILDDIDTSQWEHKQLLAALDFLYGNAEKYFEGLILLNARGEHKPTTTYAGFEDDE